MHAKLDKDNHYSFNTLRVEIKNTESIAKLFLESGFVPITQILSDINRVNQFTDAFKHCSIKKPKAKTHSRNNSRRINGYGTFVNEKQSLFYSTVISALEREAVYVIDGLLHNDVIKSSIHSTVLSLRISIVQGNQVDCFHHRMMFSRPIKAM